MNTIDIDSLHKIIINDFNNGLDNKDETWDNFYSSIDKNNVSLDVLTDIKKSYKKRISVEEYNFYLLSAIPIIEQYNSCKKKIKQISFFDSNKNNNKLIFKENCDKIVKEYLNILERFFGKGNKYVLSVLNFNEKDDENDKKNNKFVRSNLKKQSCSLCKNDTDFCVQSDNLVICKFCGNNIENLSERHISFKDISRINLGSKYTYNRRSHFRDCIKRFQGKQTTNIGNEIFENIVKELKNYNLIPNTYIYNTQNPQYHLFHKVQREHIMLILKELGYNKYYEDIAYIFHTLTNKPIPDISHLEPILLQDFDKLLTLYDQRHHDRKNFINNAYVLYQLLRKNGFKVNRNEFCHLKTNDRKYYHDVVCQELFQILNWNFSPAF